MVRFQLNKSPVETAAPAQDSLLQVLAHDLAQNGLKYGCGKAQCGACTVLVNGDPVRSCVVPLSAVEGKSVTTLAGLRQQGRPSRLQQAFIDEQAAQCGYCINGWIMTAAALVDAQPDRTDAQWREALSGLKCRCGTQVSVLRAVKRAAQQVMAARDASPLRPDRG